jgi:alpha-amylase/alpha-mannosidase (GH57 family)
VAHSFGHITQWSLDYPCQRRLYDDLHAAKANRAADPAALEEALRRFRTYEEEASRYAAWLLLDTGSAGAVPAFTNFARADIEAIVAFHRDGAAPPWHAFFDRWQREVQAGERTLRLFEPKPIPPFEPRHIDPQEVIQEVSEAP